MKQTILITGGTGLIGQELTKLLVEQGHQVHILTRSLAKKEEKGIRYFHWDINKKEIDRDCFENVNGVIHLAGASIAERWTKLYKKVIIDSRVNSATFLAEEIEKVGITLDFYIGASASGYYQPNTGQILTEESPADEGFLGEVCIAWENASELFRPLANRHIIHRIGIVLTKNGGAMEKMLPPFKFGLAPYFGNGNQYYSCTHINDVARQIIYSIENKQTNGIYNVCTEAITQKELNKQIATALNKKVIQIPTPTFALQLMLGDMHQIVTNSLRLSNEKIRSLGFEPKYATTQIALNHLLQT